MRGKSSIFLFSLAAFWLAATCGGLAALQHYSATPGAAATAASDWPATASINRPAGKYFLVMFVHPQCPCSRASIAELDRLMARCSGELPGGELAADVEFVKPAGFSQDWEKTGLWTSAGAIPGVHVSTDVNGIEAKKFDAATSGQTYLYSPAGKLMFGGGITDGRGHEGDNPGSDAIAALIGGKSAGVARTQVYGCELFDPMHAQSAGATCKR